MTYQERLNELKQEAIVLGLDLDYEPEVKGVFPEQNEDWLRARKEGIGGSDAGTILGLNHYSTVQELLYDKLSDGVYKEVTPEQQYTLDFGHAMEPLMLKLYAAKTGFKVWQGNNTQWRHPLYPFMYGDCDGYAETLEGEKIGIECKTYNYEYKYMWKSGVFGKGGVVKNPEYAAQVAHYMAVENLTRFDLIAICGNNPNDLTIVTFYRDLEFEKALIEAEKNFWDNKESGNIPEISKLSKAQFEKIANIISEGVKEKEDVTISLPESVLDIFEEYTRLSDEKSELQKKIDGIEEKQKALQVPVIEILGNNAKGEISNDDFIFTASFKPNKPKKTIDSEALAAAYPAIYEAYEKETIGNPIFKLSKKAKKTAKKK